MLRIFFKINCKHLEYYILYLVANIVILYKNSILENLNKNEI